MKELKLKKYFFIGSQAAEPIQNWFGKLKIHGKVSRNRTKFLKMIESTVNGIEETRLKLLEKHSEKSKDGKTIFLLQEFDPKTGKMNETETTDPTKDKRKRYKIKNKEEFDKEWKKYTDEEVTFKVAKEKGIGDAIYGARDLLLNTNEEFGGEGAALYDEWCEAFEQISNIDESKLTT